MEVLNYKDFPVLVVDDEKENLAAFEMEFKEYFTILTASSGKEALNLLKEKGEAALVLVDQRMPEMKGVDFLREILRLYPNTIRFLITAYSDIQVVVDAINSGHVSQYISKPWEHEDVKLSVMRALENYFLTKERERLMEEKLNTVRKAAEANRLASLGMLAAGIAHEINNPLVSINTFLKLIPKKIKEFEENPSAKDTEYWTKFYQIADDELKRVQDLVRELLNLAKPPKYDFEETQVAQLIQNEAQLFESAAKEKDVRLKMMIQENLPLVRCDRSRIKQLLLNLVINAIQATSQGGQVTIEAHSVKNWFGRRHLEISVKDTGEGIPDELKSKIFEPFFSTKKKGTGLGLVVCDFIVKYHGGEIEVESAVGKGTTFIISLPLQPPQPALLNTRLSEH